MSFFRLKDLIRAVRCSTTAADERAVIQKESAAIRSSFKEEDSQDARFVNVQKLLYIYLLGYPVRFGQLECLKLSASSRFSDKRVGYLGTQVLLDEKQEILTLLTNSLQSDMNNTDEFIIGIALCTLSNVASPEVCNDLVDEVERLLSSSRSYIRKKAALAALRIIRRVPELQDTFIGHVKSLISDKNHAVQQTGISLAIEICTTNPAGLEEITKLIPIIIRQLKTLLASGSSPEYEVGGVVDPFLQVSYLKLLRILSQDADVAEQINDVLTLVATQTDSSKNVGTAVLYECAVTILSTPSDGALRSLAINLLGKFLSHRDNNIRYVALSTLSQAVIAEGSAVQRHRATVLQCLRDPDISICRRALDLSFALINKHNVRAMVKELLDFIPSADTDFLPQMTHKLVAAATLFGPDLQWQLDTYISIAKLAGNHLSAANLFRMIRLITAKCDEGMQRYAVRRCYTLLTQDIKEEKLVLLGVWLIGEYGDLLIGDASSSGRSVDDLDGLGALSSTKATQADPDGIQLQVPKPVEVVHLIKSISNSPVATNMISHFVVTALAKLTGRFCAYPSATKDINAIVNSLRTNDDTETQTRAVELEALLRPALDGVRDGVIDRMPPPEYPEEGFDPDCLNPAAIRMRDLAMLKSPNTMATSTLFGAEVPSKNTSSAAADLLDLLGDDVPQQSTNQGEPSSKQKAPGDAVGSLADLLGDTSLSSINNQPATLDVLQEPEETDPEGFGKTYEAYSGNGVSISLKPTKTVYDSDAVNIEVVFTNVSDSDSISSLTFQAAVPKTQQLTIHPASGQNLGPQEIVTQKLEISNPTKSAVRLLIKLGYDHSSLGHQQNTIKFSGFPSTIV
ncbi:clathrin associated protein complex large subunit [Mycoemilia scoparia]|uniref:AP-1 complex subunit gamma n=1 Tax=Mycoemilia scoparia TaxID=417184 RepID=A0A9W8A3N2_9FUNG|nr:clathrin associated protein complex large subunit [Mycoemilia scoparia]